VDPFIAELSNIAGTLVCDMSIRGTLDEPRYNGSMSLQSARFFLKPLGITYVLDGKFVPAGQKIALDMVRVKNIPQDRSDGAMDISGFLTLQGLKLKDFDLLADGQLLVMKESSRRPGQTIYGDLFVASGVNGLRWRGTLQRSVVSGAVRVKNANLTLPPAREQLLQTSRDVIITLVDDTSSVAGELSSREKMERTAGGASLAVNNGPILLTNGKPTVNSIEEREERSFLDRLVYDLDVETQGPTQVRFIFNPYTGEELFAELRGRMGFTKDGELTRLTGEVEVGERSYYNFLKRFQASGKLTFTGDLLNPELNILARYESVHQTADTSVATSERQDDRRVIVLLEITGTRREPKPKFEIEEVRPSGEHVKRTSGDIESDAIAFILTGSFRDELTQQERSSLLGSNLLYGLTSSVLSGPITDFMKKEFGFINSVDVIYYGGNVQSSTDLRVTGEVGEAVIRFGGRVFSDISNTNWSVQLPLGGVLGSEKWRNLIIEAERRVEGVESYEQRRESNGLRLIYRITF
ncbi:MAG: translocation/assembly module TamB domain-containing protein, partial [Bacteroidota bacterium]